MDASTLRFLVWIIVGFGVLSLAGLFLRIIGGVIVFPAISIGELVLDVGRYVIRSAEKVAVTSDGRIPSDWGYADDVDLKVVVTCGDESKPKPERDSEYMVPLQLGRMKHTVPCNACKSSLQVSVDVQRAVLTTEGTMDLGVRDEVERWARSGLKRGIGKLPIVLVGGLVFAYGLSEGVNSFRSEFVWPNLGRACLIAFGGWLVAGIAALFMAGNRQALRVLRRNSLRGDSRYLIGVGFLQSAEQMATRWIVTEVKVAGKQGASSAHLASLGDGRSAQSPEKGLLGKQGVPRGTLELVVRE